ncbi:GDP-mannose 4,6-dehydratase [Chitinispirillales bacterium ANBcel5]|uniref:NAD-dependent epimerase/dehydratase family protein n=1 Tax=Cellulosispirillum alkaliphilum TaxID=3039283 RepID=UPI002A51493B|nr:GDP-mannose 4,6-dehydratase [Chitinispirillales bacterium ANBcel5]
MSKQVLITGGAGFIGSHLADELLRSGYRVRVLDNLCSQVHGPDAKVPSYLSKDVQFIYGDVRDKDCLKYALEGVDAVYHFAAAVGVGQSMYQIQRYTEINNIGTATLLECLVGRNIEKLVVASSMSVYGEGLYESTNGGCSENVERCSEQLKNAQWDPVDNTGCILKALPTPETKKPSLTSLYALSKYDQERMCLMLGRAYSIPVVALRFFNVYGSRQALSNPYTGVMAIFASRLLNSKSPVIFEDGNQSRDFVSVKDVASACSLVLKSDIKDKVLNIGTGKRITINEVAQMLMDVLGKNDVEPHISAKFRAGDIRHCFSDISLAKNVLGYRPKVDIKQGIIEMSEWLEGQIAIDNIEKANAELVERGLWS